MTSPPAIDRLKIDLSKMCRWRSMASSWLAKAAAVLVASGAGSRDERRWLVGYESERLLTGALSELGALVPLLQDDQVEEAERLARSLASLLRDHRLSFALAHNAGRTPEEAEAFRAKAEQLRERRWET
jgi:hypothetical protein